MSSAARPAKATTVTSRSVHCDDIQSRTTPHMTAATIRSRPLIGPMRDQFLARVGRRARRLANLGVIRR